MTLWLPRGYRAETALEIKRSRFVTTLARVDSEEDARAVVADVRHSHPAARHHCSAFIVDVAGAAPIERSSDDGEPSGTAGMPMLAALKGEGVSQAVAVVARYFGGVLLGTGGLVRAYSGAVSTALQAAPRVRPLSQSVYVLEVEHAEFGRVQDAVRRAGLLVIGLHFAQAVEVTLATPPEVDVAALAAQWSGGRATIRPAGSQIVERAVNGAARAALE